MEDYYIQSTHYSTQERTTAAGKRVIDVVFRVITLDGNTKQKRLCGFSSKKEAERGFTDYITKHCSLISPDAAAAMRDKSKAANAAVHEYTLNELFPVYITAIGSDNKGSTIWDKKKIFELYIRDQLGEIKMSALTTERLYQWQDGIMSTQKADGSYLSHKYITKIRMVLSSVLSYGETRFGIVNNISKVKLPRARAAKTEQKFWTREQFEHFISYVEDPTYKAFFSVLFFTGRRKGEVIALSAEDVKPDRIMFTKTYSRKTHDGSSYSITSTKNEKKDGTMIGPSLRKALDSYVGQAPFFFGGDKPLAEKTIENRFKKACEKAGMEPIRIHDLRHSFVAMVIHMGANMFLVADMIGDTVDQVMKTYGHMYDSDKADIISRI